MKELQRKKRVFALFKTGIELKFSLTSRETSIIQYREVLAAVNYRAQLSRVIVKRKFSRQCAHIN